MTVPVQAPDNPQVFDPGNPMIGDVPAILVTDVLQTPAGQKLVATIRIPNTTVTVTLDKDDAERWVNQFRGEIARMNGLILPPGAGLG